MVFFRLGKIDRSDRASQDGTGQGGASPLSPSAASSAIAQEKTEKPKGKSGFKEERDPLLAGDRFPSAAAGGGTDRASGSTRAGGGLSVNDFISKTKNQQRQGLKPSGPELIAYARYLGIDPVVDHDLLWIAVEALEAPLPSDWTEHFDSNDRVFYYNAQMRVSSWTHPLEHIYRETYKYIVNLRNANISAQERNERIASLQAEVKQMEHEVHKEIAQWTEHTDESGNRFYFNREERQSTWTDPRPAKCQVLYLKMKMLRLLSSGSGSAFSNTGFGADKGVSDLMRFGDRSSDHHIEDHGGKKPKVGSHKANEGGTTTTWSHNLAGGLGVGPGGGIGGGPGSAAGAFSEDEGMKSDHQQSLMDGDTPENSDSDSEERRKRKKKKKHKHKKREKDSYKEKHRGNEAEGPVAGQGVAPPPRPGTQNMRTSSSEPSVGNIGGGGTKAMHTNVEEGLQTAGRTKIKAGIRLEPLASGDPGLVTGKGGPGTTSVPSL
mmetsp:Transcript_62327/g.115678  ORF Transcript_62327/g.115678 Transcript_62327/m.115678 type:complete len:492 (+) Transcript_62327:126-1601(+)